MYGPKKSRKGSGIEHKLRETLWYREGCGLGTITVILADDHRILRHGLKGILEQDEYIEVISEVGNGREAVEACERLKPDVILLDIAMPEMSGVLATRYIMESNHKPKILILSMHLNETYIAETLRRGASGYMLKDCAADELIRAVKTVSRGETYLSPRVTKVFIDKFIRDGDGLEDTVFSILSAREQQILQIIVEGRTSKQIAEILSISPRTVDNHRASIMRKLDLHDIQSLVKFAIRVGISYPSGLS